jgi:purine-binding chemotaxis protein CheW
LVRCGARLCALPIEHVVETMRPLPLEPVPGAPPFVRGAALVRGEVTPVVDLRTLLGGDDGPPATRLVSLRVHPGRGAGLLVDGVLGVHHRAALSAETLPPLLQDAAATVVAELGRLDGELLMILRAGALIPEDGWTAQAPRGSGP